MKNSILKSTVLLLLISSSIFSCRKKHKEESNTITPIPNPIVKQDPVVFTYTENVVEQVTQELTKSVIEKISDQQDNTSLCAAKVDTLSQSDTSLVMNYVFKPTETCNINGVAIKQSGTIKISFLGKKNWAQRGTILKYEFIKYRIIEVCDTCSINNYLVEINGNQQRENLTGGNESQMKNGDLLVFEIFSRNLKYSYTDKYDRTTNQKQRISISKFNDETTTTIVGADSISSGDFVGQTNVAFWGTIWNGKPYMVKYEQPKIYKTCSGKGKVVCGSVYSIFKGAYEKRETYGVNPKTGKEYNTCNCITDTYFLQTITEGGNVEIKIYKY